MCNSYGFNTLAAGEETGLLRKFKATELCKSPSLEVPISK